MAIKHAKQSGLPSDDGSSAHVRPSDWYADHTGSAQNWHNVTDATYGAYGDGSHDDTTAIQAAITAAGQNGWVYIPPTSSGYKITSSLLYYSGQHIIGSGGPGTAAGVTSGSRLVWGGAGVGPMMRPATYATADTYNTEVKNIRFDGGSTATIGLHWYRTSQGHIEGCLFSGTEAIFKGLVIDGNNRANNAYWNSIDRNGSIHCLAGCSFWYGGQSNILTNWYGYSDTRTIEVVGSSTNLLMGIYIYASTTGIYLDYHRTRIIGLWTENCTNGIEMTAEAHETVVMGYVNGTAASRFVGLDTIAGDNARDATPVLAMCGSAQIIAGTNSPEGVVPANIGSLYLRTNGSTSTTLYVKTSGTGNTGWTAK